MRHRSLVASLLAPLLAVALVVGFAPPSARAADFPPDAAGYHSYAEMVEVIHETATAYPHIVSIFSIGTSHQGRELWAAKISDNVEFEEGEPEVLFDSLHHAREHITLEQTLAILRWLTEDYESDPLVTRLVDTRVIWIVFAVNPDGAEFDLTGNPYRGWRKNRQPNAGTTAVGTDLNRNYGYRWGCCGGSSATPSASTYRGPKAWSAPEVRAMRDFIDSRVVNGRQLIRTAITFHSAGEEILWPYGYTRKAVPSDMTKDDQAALAAMGKKMAATNGYVPKQSSALYITDGDSIDWAYGKHRIFAYTFELYPSHKQVSTIERFYPPDSILERETERNRAAILYLIDQAACPYRVTGKTKTHCGPFMDDFEIARGWKRNPYGTDTATAGVWQRARPEATRYQLATTTSGTKALVTGAKAGAKPASNDLDGGMTTIRSVPIDLPGKVGDLTFRYYLAHAANSSKSDYLRAYVETEDGTLTRVLGVAGAAKVRLPAWSSARVPLASWAGQTIRIVFRAADGAKASTVEAAIDDVRITRP